MKTHPFIRLGVVLIVLFGGLVGAGRPGGMTFSTRFARPMSSSVFMRRAPSPFFQRPMPSSFFRRPIMPMPLVPRSGTVQHVNLPSARNARSRTATSRTPATTARPAPTSTIRTTFSTSITGSVNGGPALGPLNGLHPTITERGSITTTIRNAQGSANGQSLTTPQQSLQQALQRNPQLLSNLLGLSSSQGMNGLLGSSLAASLGDSDVGSAAPATPASGAAPAILGGGSGAAPPSQVPNYVTSQPQESTEAQQISEALNALGLPNQAGRLYWPLGLRVLAPGPEVQQIRLQLDALLAQAAAGGGDARTVQEISRAVGRLRYHLAAKGSMLARTTYLEALRFLERLDDAVRQLKG